jgi:thiamine biosynthesis lipoprotein
MIRIRAAAWLVFYVALITRASATESEKLERFEFIEPHMGTLFQIVLYAPDPTVAKTAAKAAFTRVEALNRSMSDYDPESELMRLCRQPVGVAVPVSADLFSVLRRSLAISEKTAGAFDVTLGPIILLWRQARREKKLPSDEKRIAALRACGFRKLRLDPATATVTLLTAGMQLDLGGIAKGYAADAALATLTRLGFSHAMVAASGDLALGDAPPGAKGWSVKIEPFGSASPQSLTLVVANVGVSTSGDSEQFVEIGGLRYSHIVDPATGLGLTTQVAVTVVSRHDTLSDGLAKVFSVLPFTVAKKVVEHWDESVRLIVYHRNADGSLQTETAGTDPSGLISSS